MRFKGPLQQIAVAVVGRNAAGAPDVFVTEVAVTPTQYNDGAHYEMAQSKAEAEGFDGPFIAFDQYETSPLSRAVAEFGKRAVARAA